MREYRPSNRVSLVGLLLMFTAAVVGGLGAGVITYFVSREIYLIILFPILLGLACGWIMALAVQTGRVRAPLVAGAFGVLFVLVLYGTYRYAEYYWGFRGDLRDELEDAFGQKVSDDQYQQFEDIALKEEVGATGFVGYTKLTAREGVTITRASSSSDSGLTLKNTILYFYWVVEFGLMAYLAASRAYRSADKPFSEQTGSWYGKARQIGSLQEHSLLDFVERIGQGQFPQAAQLIGQDGGSLDTAIYRSTAPDDDLVLAVRRLTARRSTVETKDIYRWSITPGEWSILESGLASAGDVPTGESV